MGKAKTLRKAKGFTLIELLIVIIIIGILATIAIISYSSQSKKAKKAAFVQNMNDAVTAAAVCLSSGGTETLVTYAVGGNVCSNTTTTAVKWPTATQQNGYVPVVVTAASGITTLTMTGGTNQPAPNAVTCTLTGCN